MGPDPAPHACRMGLISEGSLLWDTFPKKSFCVAWDRVLSFILHQFRLISSSASTLKSHLEGQGQAGTLGSLGHLKQCRNSSSVPSRIGPGNQAFGALTWAVHSTSLLT